MIEVNESQPELSSSLGRATRYYLVPVEADKCVGPKSGDIGSVCVTERL